MTPTPRRIAKESLLSGLGDRLRPHGFEIRARDQSLVRPVAGGRHAVHLSFIDHDADFNVT